MRDQSDRSSANTIMASGVALALLVAACAPRSLPGPEIPEQDPISVSAGGLLYAAHCAECHGEDLKGTDKGPSHLSIVYEPGHHSDFAFEMAIKVGSAQHHWPFGAMEPVPDLNDAQIQAIIAFVRETQRLEGFQPYPPS